MDLDPPTLALVIGTAVGLILTLFGLTFLVSRFLYICPPSEIRLTENVA